ncbi:tetraspanin-8-like isoform X2 [Phycodurus eques]|uniref:tetraspanin-8-like isoform X2 n=1 Tax=Phycodurus eques TaxID=693459 RepID=UPI002ACDE157|nr:tetraspanin-8-like isoform X2 [Phycodurus eques]
MGKVNICLKRSLIIVTSLMILAGALMLAGTLFSHGHYHRDDEIEDMIVGIKVLYALSITTLVLPIVGLYAACKEKRWVLIVLGCCGVQQGYKEWGYNISKSCLCNDTSDDCVAAPSNSSLFQLTDNKAVMIYKEPCLPVLLSHLNLAIDVFVGTSAGLTSLWALSCVLSIAVLCQLKEKKDTLVVAYSREAKTGNYAVLAEPAELT